VPNTFVASANCGRYCGAIVDFVDIDSLTWNLSIPKLKEKLARARINGKLPKVLVPVHFGGQPTEQEAIWELAQEYGFRVLEDASHAIGASRNGEPVGSCRWADVAVFSFHAVKIITSGEGGMALTNNAELAERMSMLRSHGITRNPTRMRGQVDEGENILTPPQIPTWYYEQQMLGFNYRMTDIQAALGASQLERLNSYVERRNALAHRYNTALKGLPLRLPTLQAGNLSAFHLYVVRLKRDDSTKSHRKTVDELRQRGIGVNVHYIPIHLQPYYRELGFARGQFPEAEAHGDEVLSLPLYPALREQDQDRVVSVLKEVLV
jgi:dTDP-4-amino-4,6-dideoxygalactose transaminase